MMCMEPEERQRPGGDYAPWGILVQTDHWRFPCKVVSYRCLMCNPQGNADVQIDKPEDIVCGFVDDLPKKGLRWWKALEHLDHGIYSSGPKAHAKKCQSWDPSWINDKEWESDREYRMEGAIKARQALIETPELDQFYKADKSEIAGLALMNQYGFSDLHCQVVS